MLCVNRRYQEWLEENVRTMKGAYCITLKKSGWHQGLVIQNAEY